jgi:hypothetical protein
MESAGQTAVAEIVTAPPTCVDPLELRLRLEHPLGPPTVVATLVCTGGTV